MQGCVHKLMDVCAEDLIADSPLDFLREGMLVS